MKKLILALLLFATPVYAVNGFYYDTCTDTNTTNITSHTPDIGSTYTYFSGTATTINANKCRVDGTTETARNRIINAAVPPGANYYVQDVCNFSAVTNANETCGVIARKQGGASTMYLCHILGHATQRTLHIGADYASSTVTDLASANVTVTTGTDYLVRLEVLASGANVQLNCYFNGVLTVQYTDSSGSKITNKGTPGITMAAAASGITIDIDNVQADFLRGNGRRIM